MSHLCTLKDILLISFSLMLPYSPMEHTITLHRSGRGSLGFSIVGGANSSKGNSPIYIRSIAPKSIAALDGRLHSGDEVLKINGLSLANMSQSQVVQVIKNTTGTITLTVIPTDVRVQSLWWYIYFISVVKNSAAICSIVTLGFIYLATFIHTVVCKHLQGVPNIMDPSIHHQSLYFYNNQTLKG